MSHVDSFCNALVSAKIATHGYRVAFFCRVHFLTIVLLLSWDRFHLVDEV